MSTCKIRGARRGSILHCSLPVKVVILPGPASKNMQTVQRWGAPPTPGRSGTVGVPVGANGGDALSHPRVEFSKPNDAL